MLTQKQLDTIVGLHQNWGSYLLVAPDGTATYAYLNVFPDGESDDEKWVLELGVPVAPEDLGELYDDFRVPRLEDQPMLEKYYQLYLEAQAQGFYARIEGNQIFGGDQYGDSYTSAQVTDTEKARLVLLRLLRAGIEDGATLNVHLGLAGLCPSWELEDVARVWVRSGNPGQILIMKSATEIKTEIARGLGKLEPNTLVPNPDPEAVLAAMRTRDFPSTKDALKAIYAAVRRVSKANRNK